MLKKCKTRNIFSYHTVTMLEIDRSLAARNMFE